MNENFNQYESGKKVYVDVVETRRKDGRIIPRSFVWEDGKSYDIQGVTDIRRAASLKGGGIGLRYTVIVPYGKGRTRETFMWLEEEHAAGRWFMERREA